MQNSRQRLNPTLRRGGTAHDIVSVVGKRYYDCFPPPRAYGFFPTPQFPYRSDSVPHARSGSRGGLRCMVTDSFGEELGVLAEVS